MPTFNPSPFDATKPEGYPASPSTAEQRDQHAAGNLSFTGAHADVAALEGDVAALQGVVSAKGELFGHDGVAPVAVPAPGADALVLVSESTEASGIKWEASQSLSPTQSKGDLIARGELGVDERVPAGADGTVVGYLSTAEQGLKAFQVVKPSAPFAPDELLVVDSAAPNDETVRTVGLTPGQLARIDTGNAFAGAEDSFQSVRIVGAGTQSLILDGGTSSAAIAYDAASLLTIGPQGPGAIALSIDGVDAVNVTPAREVGIGIGTPDGTLHVHTASAGTVAATSAASDFVVETNTSGGMTILGPDTATMRLGFGSPSNTLGSQWSWNYNARNCTLGGSVTGATLTLTSNNRDTAVHIDDLQNVIIGGGTARGANARRTLILHDAVPPTNDVPDAIQLYSEKRDGTSEFIVRDGDGNITVLSPHRFELAEPSERDGETIEVDMLRVVRLLERLSGETLVHTRRR